MRAQQIIALTSLCSLAENLSIPQVNSPLKQSSSLCLLCPDIQATAWSLPLTSHRGIRNRWPPSLSFLLHSAPVTPDRSCSRKVQLAKAWPCLSLPTDAPSLTSALLGPSRSTSVQDGQGWVQSGCLFVCLNFTTSAHKPLYYLKKIIERASRKKGKSSLSLPVPTSLTSSLRGSDGWGSRGSPARPLCTCEHSHLCVHTLVVC